MLVTEALRAPAGPAFATLVGRYQRLVAALVIRATGGRADVDDLVQDVFLEAYRRLPSLREPARFKGWLVRVALNRARAWGRERRAEAGALPRVAARAAPAGDEAARLEGEEDRRRLLHALRELPEDTQAVVTLRYLEQKSAAEIGEVLGLRPEAVRMRLSRALALLRARLRPREDAP